MQRLNSTLLVFTLVFCASLSTADEVDGVTNYAYAVFVGTGKYSVSDRDIYIFRAPLSFDLEEIDLEAGDNTGIRLLAPVAIGLTNFEHLDELPELDVKDLQSISFVPGVEVPIALDQHWLLNPFVQAGFGVDTKSDSESFIWGAGIRTSARFGDEARWIVGAEFLRAGNNPTSGDDPSTSFSRLGLGTEYKIPTNWLVFDRYVSWHLRAIHWYFSDPVVFDEPLVRFELNDSTEVGLSLGLSRPINLWGYDLTQMGVGYEWATDYKAIKFFTTFPF
ncbi:MAG: hypothetical protein V7746_25430 [Halioglobus sp.]